MAPSARDWAASVGFDTVLDASGGFYDQVMNLQTWYLGRTLSLGAFGGGDGAAPEGYNGTDDTTSGYSLVDRTPEGLPVNVLPQADKKLEITGTVTFKMTQFKVDPPAPKIALGLIKTGDEVKLIFKWVLGQRKAAAAGTP